MSTTAEKPWTADELGRLPEGWRYEIDEGELVIMAPAGIEHGDIAGNVDTLLRLFVRAHRLGKVATGEPGFFLRHGPTTLRAPDVAFISNERLARIPDLRRFSEVPPDLAVEVRSPSEAHVNLDRKVAQYLAAGVRAVWVVDPEHLHLTQHRAGSPPHDVADLDAAVEEPVLPGFSCRLREIFGAD